MKNYFKIRVSRESFNCWVCKKSRPKGTQKIGYDTCFLCVATPCDNRIKDYKNKIKDYKNKFRYYQNEIKKIQLTKKTLIKNKDKWEKDLILNSI